jgi:hypothetical protein
MMSPDWVNEKREVRLERPLTMLLSPLCKLEPLLISELQDISYDWVATRPWGKLAVRACDITNYTEDAVA